MTITDAIRDAVRRGDAAQAVRVAEMLRAAGADYHTTLSIARRACARDGITLEAREWDALLYEGETAP